MCGINGYIDKTTSKNLSSIIHQMNKILIHRGPDDSGFLVKNNIALGMQRLYCLKSPRRMNWMPLCSSLLISQNKKTSIWVISSTTSVSQLVAPFRMCRLVQWSAVFAPRPMFWTEA